jgi:hypothetical protein
MRTATVDTELRGVPIAAGDPVLMLYAAANDFDIHREWAMAVVHGRPSQRPSPAWDS